MQQAQVVAGAAHVVSRLLLVAPGRRVCLPHRHTSQYGGGEQRLEAGPAGTGASAGQCFDPPAAAAGLTASLQLSSACDTCVRFSGDEGRAWRWWQSRPARSCGGRPPCGSWHVPHGQPPASSLGSAASGARSAAACRCSSACSCWALPCTHPDERGLAAKSQAV